MGAKKITLVFLSDGSRKVRQFKFSKSFLVFLFLFFLTAAVALAWVIRDYHGVKAKIPQLAQLEKENKQQRAQLVALVRKIDRINEKMIELKEFDYKLKAMVNLEPNEDNPQFLGIGGSDPGVSNPDYSVEKAHKKLARLMHRSIDNLKSEISIRKNEKVDARRSNSLVH